jgi:hypothetical protein
MPVLKASINPNEIPSVKGDPYVKAEDCPVPDSCVRRVGLVASVMAQQPAATLTMKQLKPSVGWTRRLRRNSTIIVGQTGVIVVDAKQTEAGAKDLLAEIAKIPPKPVKTVILTTMPIAVNGLVLSTGIKSCPRKQQEGIAGGDRFWRLAALPERQAADCG